MSEPSLKEQYMALDGANRFLAEHCGKTLADIRKQNRGISHSVNRCNAEYANCWAAVEELREQVAEQVAEQARILSETVAAVGKLQEAMEKSREAYAAIQKKLKQGGTP